MTCKIHVLCDAAGHPLHFELTAGQAHEAAAFDAVMVGVDASLIDTDGEPVAWPVTLAGDKGYRADWIDEYLIGVGDHAGDPEQSQPGPRRPAGAV